MLHIVVLNKGYFPEKIKAKDSSKDRVVVIALATDSIPVSAYQNEMLKNMEVKLLPDIKDTTSAEGKGILRITQAILIGQLTASEKDYEIYSDDAELLKALAPFTGKKVPVKKQAKKASSEPAPKKIVEKPAKEKKAVRKTEEKKKEEKKPATTAKKKPMVSSDVVKSAKATKDKSTTEIAKETTKKADKPARKKADITGKLPTLAQVKKVIGAANSSHAKIIHATLKKSNQITFEMNVRMELAKAGLDAGTCQELAKTLNDEFGKDLPTS